MAGHSKYFIPIAAASSGFLFKIFIDVAMAGNDRHPQVIHIF